MDRNTESRSENIMEDDAGTAKESIEELRARHDLKNMWDLLVEENARYTEQKIATSAELEGINISIVETEEHIANYTEKKKISIDNIQNTVDHRNRLTDELNVLRLQINAAAADAEKCRVIQDTLDEELDAIKDEKEIIINRLQEVSKGVTEICREKDFRAPRVREHDEIFNKAYRLFKETENRMEVSVQLKSR